MANITNNGTGTFNGTCSSKTKELVIGENSLGDYLQAKMAQLTGKRVDEVLLGTPFTIAARYANSEGVISAMSGAAGFVKGLRIDLQTAHTIGGVKYATIQVQWGTGMDGRSGGAYCGALVKTDTQFSVTDLRTALTNSLASKTYWKIDP